MTKRKSTKEINNDPQNIYMYIKLKIELRESHKNLGVNSGAPEG
jgi:hypothetical protein